MYENNYYNNGYNAFGNIMNPTQTVQQPQTPMRNLLTDEEINNLRNSSQQHMGEFFRAPTPEDTARAICTHKYKTGQLAIRAIGDGRYHCDICGRDFNLLDGENMEAIEEACNKVYDIFQSIKTYYGPATDDLKGIYPALNVLTQLPHMFKTSYDLFKSAIGANNPLYSNPNYYNASNMYASITGTNIPGLENSYNGGMMYNGAYGYQPQPVMYPQPQQYPAQPMYGANTQPAYYPQPAMNQAPAYGYPQPQPQNQQSAQIQYQPPVQVAPSYQGQSQQQTNTPPPVYSAVNNPIGTVQPTAAPAPVSGPTNTENVNVGTKPVTFSA